jgi:hypothetical protein
MFSVSPSKFTVPAPLIGPVKANVPFPPAEPNVNKAPELTVHDPMPVPPPLMFNCPALARTCPVLLKVPSLPYTPLVVVDDVPPDFWNVPVLLNVLLLPVYRYTKLSFWMSQVPELLIVDPFSINRSPLPGLDVHAVVPAVFSTRPISVNWLALEKVIPPLALVVAFVPVVQVPALNVEHIVPAVQISWLGMFRMPGEAPPMMPPEMVTVAGETLTVPVPKSIVAPLKITAPAPLIGPLCANRPPEKLIVPMLGEVPVE